LFQFAEDALMQLDGATDSITANFPLYFCLQLPQFFGVRLKDNYSEINSVLDLQEGSFTGSAPAHPDFLEGDYSFYISQLLKAQHPDELTEIRLNKMIRKNILFALQ